MRIKLFLILCMCFSLCACSTGFPLTDNIASQPLPTGVTTLIAPIGEASLNELRTETLYLPMYDTLHLSEVQAEVTYSLSKSPAESLTRALLAYPGDGTVAPLGGETKLTLYGNNPVEVSGGVCTVNLSASALRLDKPTLYVVSQAIANTLISLPNIDYVNVLIADRAIGLDISNQIPMGTLNVITGEDISAHYQAQTATHFNNQNTKAETPLLTDATFYYPLADSAGIMSMAKNCFFESKKIDDMAISILSTLSEGNEALGSPELPLLIEMLEKPPSIMHELDAGARVLELYFSHSIDDMLSAYKITRTQWVASITYTLSTFFPNLTGVRIYIGGNAVNTLMLTSDFDSSINLENSIAQRNHFSSLLYNYTTLYNSTLEPILTPLPSQSLNHPHSLIISTANMLSFPELALTDADILGLSLNDNCLVVNFATVVWEQLSKLSPAEVRSFAFACVNALCELAPVECVQFFVGGEVISTQLGGVDWSGVFMPLYVGDMQ